VLDSQKAMAIAFLGAIIVFILFCMYLKLFKAKRGFLNDTTLNE